MVSKVVYLFQIHWIVILLVHHAGHGNIIVQVMLVVGMVVLMHVGHEVAIVMHRPVLR